MATPSIPASSFLRLPREIRDEIYELIFATATLDWLTIQNFPYTDRVRFPDSWVVPNPDPTALFHAFPAICCVSRQLFIEATPKLLASPNWGPTCTLNEDTSTLLYTWLEQFPDGEAFKTITAIRVEDWSMGIKAHMDLALRCPRLRHMTINFCLDRHVKLPKDTKSGLPEFETIPLELMAAYQLERLFEIPNLESLVWIFKSIKAEKPLKEFAHRAIKPIRKMFLHGCNRRGRAMTLKYRYVDSADRMYGQIK